MKVFVKKMSRVTCVRQIHKQWGWIINRGVSLLLMRMGHETIFLTVRKCQKQPDTLVTEHAIVDKIQ